MADGNLNKELIVLQKQLENLGAKPKEIDAIRRAFNALAGDTAAAAAEVERVRKRVEQLRSESESLNTPFKDLLSIVQQNYTALDKNTSAISKAKTLQNKVLGITQDLKMDNEGLVDLSKRQLDSKLQILEKTRAELASNAELAQLQLDQLKANGDILGKDKERADKLKEILKYSEDFDIGLNGIIAKTKERLGLETSINKNMGVAGALVGGTGALMERLGMRSGIFHQAMEDANEEMRDMAKNMGENVSFMNKLKVGAAGFSKLADGFGPALRDPTVIAGSLVSAFLEVNKAQTEFVRRTGQAASSMGGVNTEVATLTDMLGTATDLSKQTGLNAALVFTPEQVGGIADATALLGLSAEHAGGLAMMMKLSGENMGDIEKNISSQVSAGIDQLGVLEDVASASDDITASFGGSTKELGAAANAAKKLGMDLAAINKIEDGLLDFESSIEAELEAQLLTGKSINLSKARELALNNDLQGVAEELKKNGASAAEFAGMNRIEQAGLAKALGMSREELAKTVLTEKARASMTKEQIAAARGVTLEQSKQMDIQERIKKSVDRLAQAFSPILEAVVPIVEAVLGFIRPIAAGIGYLLKFKAVSIALTATFAVLAGYMAVKRIANFVGVGIRGFSAMSSSIKGLGGGVKGLIGLTKGAGKSITESFTKGLGGNKVKAVFDKTANRFRDVSSGKFVSADKAKALGAKMPGKEISSASAATSKVKPGKNIRVFLKNLAAGLKSMANMKVLYGALNLIPASIGLVAMIPGVIGAKLMEKLSGPKLLVSMQSLAQGLTAMGTGKVLLGTLGLLASALAFTLMIPASAGMALMGLTAPMAATGIFALIPALTALGTAMASGVGALGLLALIGLAVGLGAAFALIGAGAMMFGKGIQFAAEGVVLIMQNISGLVSMIPSLYLLGGALMSIAGGLGAIALTGMAALPALAGLSLFAIAVTPIALAAGAIFGDSGESDTDGFAKIESKLDTLINVIATGGDVYLDSDRIGRTAAKSFSIITA